MILVSGSLAFDRIMDFPGYFRDHILPDKLHEISVSFVVNDVQEYFGGTAGNIAYNLALLGEHPVILSSAGTDYEPYRRWQNRHGIDTRAVKIVSRTRTASAFIMTDKADNQITAFHPGAMAYSGVMSKKLQSQLLKKIQWAIVSPGNLDDMRHLPTFYKKHSVPYIYDPGQAIPALSKKDLEQGITGARILIVNDYELALIQKKTGFTKRAILDKVEILAVTLGEKGSLIETAKGQLIIPAAKPRAVVDPTGAGDAYRAGFLYGLMHTWPLETTGRFAALIAVYTVEKKGTQTHGFNWKTLMRRYKENFKTNIIP